MHMNNALELISFLYMLYEHTKRRKPRPCLPVIPQLQLDKIRTWIENIALEAFKIKWEYFRLYISQFIMTKQSIWDMAIAHQTEKRQNTSSTTLSAQHKETTLLFVGSRNVGKTTLIHRFLERQETSKPTLALEYTFGRKTNQNLAKVKKFIILLF